MNPRRFGFLASTLVALLLGSAATAFGPRDLESRPPYQENPTPLLPGEARRSVIERLPKPPPPEYAWWYLKKEREAKKAGRPDPWSYHRIRKSEGLHPQPGYAVARPWERMGHPYPEGRGPRDLRRDHRSCGSGRFGRRPPPGSGEPRGPVDSPPATGTREELLKRGRRLFERPPGPGRAPCVACHAGTENLEGAYFRYPAYDGHLSRIISLEERVNLCRSARQGCRLFEPGSRDLVAMLLHLRELGGRE